jgi:hypothetical protein
VTAVFTVERHPKRGERAVRTTTGKPKALTYASRVRIVDGDDGRIYIAEQSIHYRMISIMRGTMDYQHESVCQGEPRYAELTALFA